VVIKLETVVIFCVKSVIDVVIIDESKTFVLYRLSELDVLT
jgi:hypothetical protein